MKTTTVARGFIGAVASLLGVVAVGCSAGGWDEGAAGEGEIGSVEQAITVKASTGASMPAGLGRQFHASCKIQDPTDSNKVKIVVAGGFDSAGTTALGSTLLLDPATGGGTYVGSSIATLGTARGNAKMITDPSNPAACIIFGGSSTFGGGTTHASMERLSHNGTNWVWSAFGTSNPSARARFDLRVCTDSNNAKHFVLIGGDASGTPTANSIEVSNNVSGPSSWAASSLVTDRYDFAIAKDPTAERYVLAGGANLGGVLRTIETIQFDGSCVPDVDQMANAAGSRLTTAVEGNVAVPVSSTVYDFMAGRDVNPATLLDKDRITVTWGATPTVSIANTANVLTAGVYLPTLAQANGQFVLLGGSDAAFSATTATSTAQAHPFTGANDIKSLDVQGRVGATAETIAISGVDHIFLMGGKDLTGAALVLTDNVITNP